MSRTSSLPSDLIMVKLHGNGTRNYASRDWKRYRQPNWLEILIQVRTPLCLALNLTSETRFLDATMKKVWSRTISPEIFSLSHQKKKTPKPDWCWGEISPSTLRKLVLWVVGAVGLILICHAVFGYQAMMVSRILSPPPPCFFVNSSSPDIP